MTAPREHGFLYGAPMALANVRGDKTNTRRGITCSRSLVDGEPFPRKLWSALRFDLAWVDPGPSPAGNPGPYLKVPWTHPEDRDAVAFRDRVFDPDDPTQGEDRVSRVYCRVRKGDRIWQRETWAPFDDKTLRDRDRSTVFYRADALRKHDSDGTWRSPLHLPRWACRYVAEVVTDPWPQRIGEITEEQCRAEGVASRAAFEELWRRINGAWQPDVWVWTYEYREVKP